MPEIVPLSDSWLTKLYNGFLLRLGFPLLPPVQYKKFNQFQALIYTPSLQSLARDLEFNFSKEDRKLLKYYDLEVSKINRLLLLLLLFPLLYWFYIVLCSEAVRRVLLWLYNYDSSIENANLYLRSLFALLAFLMIFFLGGEKINKENIIKILDSIFTKYAEALALREIFYLVKELKKEDVLKKWKSRKVVIKRIRFLARITKLIGFKYSRQEQNRNSRRRIRRNYQNRSAQINDKATWLKECKPTTHYDLDRYFRNLAPIYLRQEYGEIELKNIEVDRRQINWLDINAAFEWIKATVSWIVNIRSKI